MEFVLIILNEQSEVEKALSALSKSDVSGVTVYDSESLGQYLGETSGQPNDPLKPIGISRTACKTIAAVLQDGERFTEIDKRLKKNGVNLEEPGVGEMISLPVREFVGASTPKRGKSTANA